MTSVVYFEIKHRVVSAFCNDGERVDFYKSMGDLERELSDKHFVRVHRSYLVNFRCIQRIEQKEVVLCGGVRIPLGLTYKGQIKKDYFENSPQIRDLV